MAANPVRSFIVNLSHQGRQHPLYLDIGTALIDSGDSAVLLPKQESGKQTDNLWPHYERVIKLLNRRIKRSDKYFLEQELEKVIADLKQDIVSKQLQLKLLQAILDYAKSHFGIDSRNMPNIVLLRRDKPILTPVHLTKLPIIERLNTLLYSELTKPNRKLDQKEKQGRLVFILYWTVNIESFDDLRLIVQYPNDIFYAGGLCFWECQNIRVESRRYVLSDVAVMALQQYQLGKGSGKSLDIRKNDIRNALNNYLSRDPNFDWSGMSLLKLRNLRKIQTVLRFGPVQFRMFMISSISQSLPIHAFLRLITDKASVYTDPHLQEAMIVRKASFRSWSAISETKTTFVPITKTIERLKIVTKHLTALSEKNISRTECLLYVSNILDEPSIKNNCYLWLLCSWLYSLLKHGGTVKKRLRISTVIDYVNSLSRPFLTVFSSCDISLLNGSSWAEKLNEATEYFTSAQRKKTVYYFGKYLIDSEFVSDLCLSDIDVIGSASKVDANLVSPSHVRSMLEYFDRKYDDCKIHRYAYFLLCLCFYSGLRRDEAAKLRLSDFTFALLQPVDGFDYVLLSVRPNSDRELKTSSSRRPLPLDALWPKYALKKLRGFWHIKQDLSHKKNSSLFDSNQLTNQAFDLLTRVMRYYTKDHSLRIHHLRHSFANWTWCRLNSKIVKDGRVHLSLFDDEMFDEIHLNRLNERLRYRENTRKKMFILSHLMGHKNVQSTLTSYLHLKDILYYLQNKSRFELTKYFTSECIGRATVLLPETGLSIAERINYYTQETSSQLSIRPHPLVSELSMPKLVGFSEDIKPTQLVSSLTWAKALSALKTSPMVDVASYFSLPLEQLQAVLNNAQVVHQQYPRRGKHLPLTPKFPHFSDYNSLNDGNRDIAKSTRVFEYLCGRLDDSIQSRELTIDNIRMAMEILRFAVPGKSNALRCPNSRVTRMFLRVCQILKLKSRHLRFRFYEANIDKHRVLKVKNIWLKEIKSFGFDNPTFAIAQYSENEFLGKHDGYGFLEVDIVNNAYKKVQRHQSIFSFLHLMLILSIDAR